MRPIVRPIRGLTGIAMFVACAAVSGAQSQPMRIIFTDSAANNVTAFGQALARRGFVDEGALSTAVARNLCMLHGQGGVASPAARQAIRVATGAGTDSVTLERVTTTCERRGGTAPTRLVGPRHAVVSAAALELADTTAAMLRFTLEIDSQVVDGDLTGERASWAWGAATSWRLVQYRRAPIDALRPGVPAPLKRLPIPRPPLRRD